MPLSFQIEPSAKWYDEAKPLIYAHWQELGLDTDLEGDIDIHALTILEETGQCSLITARKDGELIGYLLAFHRPHLHYKSSPPVFIVDMYYISPPYRSGAGVRLFMFMQDYAKRIGCIKIYLSCKVHEDHSKIFEALGFKLSDYAFVKRI